MSKFVLLATILSLSVAVAVSETKQAVKVPEFRGMDLVNKKEISLKEYEGHVLLIDFWATWCGPCKKEIPGFIELYKKYKDKKFAIIGVSVDDAEELVKDFIAKNKVNYPMVMKTNGMLKAYGEAIGSRIEGIPTSIMVNRKGEIAGVHVGFKEKSDFEKQILSLLKEPYPINTNKGSDSKKS